jgi:hypothetical protein
MAELPTPPTDAELAAAGRLAILQAMTTGKSVTFNGRTWTGQDLADLQAFVGAAESRAAAGGLSSTRIAAYCKGV